MTSRGRPKSLATLVAEALGVSPRTARRWLNGSHPTDAHLNLLTRSLDPSHTEALLLAIAAARTEGPRP